MTKRFCFWSMFALFLTILSLKTALGQAGPLRIQVQPTNPLVVVGNTQSFSAMEGFFEGGPQTGALKPITVQWSSSPTSVATIDPNTGVATAVGAGTATITATSGSFRGSTTIVITASSLSSITVTPNPTSIPAGETQQFTATGNLSGGGTQPLTTVATWSSSNNSIAMMISNAGVAIGVAASSAPATITAAFNGIQGTASLTVTSPVLVSVAVTPINPSVAKGLTEQFTATGTYSDSSTHVLPFGSDGVSWSSTNMGVATIVSSGLTTTVGQGTTTIQVTSGTKSGSTLLTVTPPVLESVAVGPTNPSVAKGLTEQFTATGTYSDSSTHVLPFGSDTVSWSSLTMSVATINPTSGLASAVGQGTSSIQATSGAKSGTTTLTVTPPMLVSIAVTPPNPPVAKGLTQQFTATGTYSDSSTHVLPFGSNAVSWSSLTMSVATINSSGGLASAVGQGTSTIQATSGTINGTTMLTVTAPVLVSIAVTPSDTTIAAPATQRFTATGTFSDNSTQNLTSTATWKSSLTTVATINSSGLATGVSAGTTQISATQSSISGSTMLTVTGGSIPEGILYVAGKTKSQIYTWDNASTVTSSTAPTHTLSGNSTQHPPAIDAPQGLFIEPGSDELYIVDTTEPMVAVLNSPNTLNGTVSVSRRLFGVNVTLSIAVSGIAVDATRNVLFVSDGNVVHAWDSASTITGNAIWNRNISGLILAEAIFDDATNNVLYVADFSTPTVSIYNNASTFSGSAASRKLSGSLTKITSPAGVTMDSSRNMLYVSDSSSNSILIWNKATTVNGDVAPVAVISGSNTQLSKPCHLALDVARDELYVGSFSSTVSKVLVFKGVSTLTGTNNLAPSRTITVPSTAPFGVALDPSRNN